MRVTGRLKWGYDSCSKAQLMGRLGAQGLKSSLRNVYAMAWKPDRMSKILIQSASTSTGIWGADRVWGRGEMRGREGGEEGEGGGRRGGGRREKRGREKRGREEGEGRGKGREGKRGKFCARAARAAPEGTRETRGREGGGKGAGGGRCLPPCPPPRICRHTCI